ncbi:MAG: NADH-quinone oxidoreductase subunit L, partial [Pseudomonadota bacterium]
QVSPARDVLATLSTEKWESSLALLLHAPMTLAFWFALVGVVLAWFLWLKRPDIPENLHKRFHGLYVLLERKYFFDDLWIKGFAGGGRRIGSFLSEWGDQTVIDGWIVNGTANTVGRVASIVRNIQTGYLYSYAFAMIIGLAAILSWLIWLR